MPPIRVLQIGMTKNIGGLETYLMQQFRHLDKSKVVYDFVNITGEYDIVFRTEIESAGSRILKLSLGILIQFVIIGNGLSSSIKFPLIIKRLFLIRIA